MPSGILTAAQSHFKWRREGGIVIEGHRDSGGCLSGKFSLSRACISQGNGEI